MYQISGLLLLEFFAFYHLMDFNAGRVSLVSGQLEPFNSERCPLHLENPLEPQLNAGRNVGEEELKQFQVRAQFMNTFCIWLKCQ